MENPINPWMIWGENPLFLETSIFAGCVYFLFDDGERCVPFVVPWRKRTRQELFQKEDGGPNKKRYLSSESHVLALF